MPLYDGLDVIGTCRDCGDAMIVIDRETTHATCNPRPAKAETLATGYLSCLRADDWESAELTRKEIDELDSAPPRFLAAALLYAKWGWPVFPLSFHDKRPAISKRRGGNGVKDATTDVARIRKYWTANPAHNIGIATGLSFDVLDVDPKAGGVTSFQELLSHHAIPQVHGIVATANGGIHLYLQRTGDGNGAALMPGVDYRGLGGYVVAPPSRLAPWPAGRDYSWISRPSPNIKIGSLTQ